MEESMGLFNFEFFGTSDLLVLHCFTPRLFNNLLLTAPPWFTPPLGRRLWPDVLLDCMMGQSSSLVIFTYLVSCWQQDRGCAVQSILKLWERFDQKNEKWSKFGINRATREKKERFIAMNFLVCTLWIFGEGKKWHYCFLHNGIHYQSKFCFQKFIWVFFSENLFSWNINKTASKILL